MVVSELKWKQIPALCLALCLTVALDDAGNVSRWTMNKDWDQTETIDGLWPGN